MWLSERVREKKLLIVCLDGMVEQLLVEVACKGIKIELDEQALTKVGKKRIWSQLEFLMN